MLKYIDVLLGVALVMLGVSLIITIVTQMLSFAFNFRGKRLRDGLAELLRTLPGGIADSPTARKVADALLQHPLISDGVGSTRLTPAVSRTDLVNLLSTPGLLDKTVGKDASDKLARMAGDVDRWFDATMSRVSNRFGMQTRYVTIVSAVVLAFALQLDVFGLIKQLYVDSDLRASLVGATGAMLGSAEQALAPTTVYKDVAATLAGESEGALPGPPPPTVVSRAAAESWIRDKVTDRTKADQLVVRYQALLENTLKAKFPGMFDQIVDIKRDLERSSGFRLVPEPYRPWDFASIWVLLGVVASAALLSLGAPFWFNMLKTASNLRPAIAAHIDNRQPAEAPRAQPSAAPPAAQPSTPGLTVAPTNIGSA